MALASQHHETGTQHEPVRHAGYARTTETPTSTISQSDTRPQRRFTPIVTSRHPQKQTFHASRTRSPLPLPQVQPPACLTAHKGDEFSRHHTHLIHMIASPEAERRRRSFTQSGRGGKDGASYRQACSGGPGSHSAVRCPSSRGGHHARLGWCRGSAAPVSLIDALGMDGGVVSQYLRNHPIGATQAARLISVSEPRSRALPAHAFLRRRGQALCSIPPEPEASQRIIG